MNRPLVMLHGIHLNDYEGSLDGFYAGGFKWAAENRWGGEVLNFRPTSGRCYGHVEVLENSIIRYPLFRAQIELDRPLPSDS
jgi:hypothetical protein